MMIEPQFNQSTLASFIKLFEKEMKESESVREAHNFSRLAVELAGFLEEQVYLRDLMHCLINSALRVSSGVYKARNSSGPVWWEEVREELTFCRKILGELETKLSGVKLIDDLKRQCNLLEKTVGEKVKRR